MSVQTRVLGLRRGKRRPRWTQVSPLFGVAVFDSEQRRRIEEIVVLFSSAEAAERYASLQGLAEFEVASLRLDDSDPLVRVVVPAPECPPGLVREDGVW